MGGALAASGLDFTNGRGLSENPLMQMEHTDLMFFLNKSFKFNLLP